MLRKGKVKNGGEKRLLSQRFHRNSLRLTVKETGALVFHLIPWLLDPSTQSQLKHQYFKSDVGS